jgi:hypothetical protein
MTNKDLQNLLATYDDSLTVVLRHQDPNIKDFYEHGAVEVTGDISGELIITAFTAPWLGNCLCVDPLCPHCCGKCQDKADSVVFRSDMQDETGTQMCSFCAEDALNSGVYNLKEETNI